MDKTKKYNEKTTTNKSGIILPRFWRYSDLMPICRS